MPPKCPDTCQIPLAKIFFISKCSIESYFTMIISSYTGKNRGISSWTSCIPPGKLEAMEDFDNILWSAHVFIDSRATLHFSADLSASLQHKCDLNFTIKNAKMHFLLCLETLEFDIMKSPGHALSKNVGQHLPYIWDYYFSRSSKYVRFCVQMDSWEVCWKATHTSTLRFWCFHP